MTTSLGSDLPVATRTTAPGWRDPRLWLGVAIVAASVLAGARVLGQADRSVSVWAARAELPAGEVLEPEDLVAHRVRFLDGGDEALYLRTDQELPDSRSLLRPVAPGELVPVSALGDVSDTGLLTVPLSVPALAVPPDIGPGSVVDVWVTTQNDAGRNVSRPLLTRVVVIAAPARPDSFGVTGDRQLVLGVEEGQASALGRTLAAVGDSSITVVGRG